MAYSAEKVESRLRVKNRRGGRELSSFDVVCRQGVKEAAWQVLYSAHSEGEFTIEISP